MNLRSVLVVSCAILLAGCGGSRSENDSSTPGTVPVDAADADPLAPAPAEPKRVRVEAARADPAAPAPAEPKSLSAEPSEAKKAVITQTAWGTGEDPDGDCQIQVEDSVATIKSPGTVHNLLKPPGRNNAPRILRPIEGDFAAQVLVSMTGNADVQPAHPSRVSYHGAGLLLWGNGEDFVRLERALVATKGGLESSILFQRFVAGSPPGKQNVKYPDGPIHLRMERRSTTLYGWYSRDGQKWEALRPFELTPTQSKVGILVVNTSSADLQARFEGLKTGKSVGDLEAGTSSRLARPAEVSKLAKP